MSEHTPTPWQQDREIVWVNTPGEQEQHRDWLVYTSDETDVAKVYRAADAAFICKAVNSHDALVKALKNARNCIDTLIVNSPDKKKRRNLGEFIREIDGALASVKVPT